MPDKEIMLRIQAREEQYAWSALDAQRRGLAAAMDSMPREDDEVHAFRDALANLAESFRASADDYAAAKLKGAQTAHVIPLRNAAQQLDVVIKQLDQPRRAPLGQLQPAESPTAGADLDEPQHMFRPGDDGRTCKHCDRFASHPAHRLDGPTERPGLDALIADASAASQAPPVPVTAYLPGVTLVDCCAHMLEPDEDPAPWCDCTTDDRAEHAGPCRFKAHIREQHNVALQSVISSDDVAAYLSGVIDELPGGVPLQPSAVTDATVSTVDAFDAGFAEGIKSPLPLAPPRENLENAPVTMPPVPLLGQPGDMGAGYSHTYVPAGARPLTFAELMTPVAAAALPPHLSHSQADTLADCPAKYRLQRLESTVIQIPQWANIGGTAFHAAVEDIELWAAVPGAAIAEPRYADELWRKYFDAEVQRIEQSSPVPRDRWRAASRGAEGESWWNANGPEMLRRYLRTRPDQLTLQFGVGAEDGKVLPGAAIEWEVEAQVPTPYGPLPYKAVIDRVTWDVRRGAYVIRDYKTGKEMPDDSAQLGEYAHTLRLAGKVFTDAKIYGTFFNARKGEWTPEIDLLEAWPLDWFVWRVTSAHADKLALTQGPTPARPSTFCGGCSVRYACPVKNATARR